MDIITDIVRGIINIIDYVVYIVYALTIIIVHIA